MDAIAFIDVLPEETCRFLLSTEEVGRVAFVDDDGYPVVLPVNYRLDRDRILFRTAPGSKLDHIPLRAVAFEVDHLAPTARAGWSVLVQGHGAELTHAVGPAYADLREQPIAHWAPGVKEHWLAIEIDRITGRKVVNATGPPSPNPPGDY
jgi:uncharacterized protein